MGPNDSMVGWSNHFDFFVFYFPYFIIYLLFFPLSFSFLFDGWIKTSLLMELSVLRIIVCLNLCGLFSMPHCLKFFFFLNNIGDLFFFILWCAIKAILLIFSLLYLAFLLYILTSFLWCNFFFFFSVSGSWILLFVVMKGSWIPSFWCKVTML